MNDRATELPDPMSSPLLPGQPDPALPKGMRLGTFEIQRVISRSASAIVYLATDHALAMPVAIQEYLPARLMRRDAGLRLVAAAAWHDDLIERGLRAFVDEARMLARAEHPSLVRVHQLFIANGSAYRVMPVYTGRRLSDLRRQMVTPPDEAALRALLDGLLGAIETIHQTGQVHGGVAPENILLLADDCPLLLGAGAAAREIGSDLVESLMATLAPPADAASGAESGTPPTGAARDLYMLAGVMRFCITAEAPTSPEALRQREPMASAVTRHLPPQTRPPYSAALLDALDAALSPFAQDRSLNAAQFRDWLARGVPAVPGSGAKRASSAPVPTPATRPEPPTAAVPAAAAAAAPAADFDTIAPQAEVPMAPWPEVVRATDPPFSYSGSSYSGLSHSTPSHADSSPSDPSHPPRPNAPPLPLPVPTATRHRQQRYKWLLGCGLAVLAAAILAFATGAWNLAPEITLGPDAQRIVTPAPRAALESASQAAPLTLPRPVTEPLPRTARETLPPAVEQTVPRAATAPALDAPSPPAADELASETPRPSPPPVRIDPARTLAAHPPAAGPTRRIAATAPSAAGGSPRETCAGRTEFALYRCMVQQCQTQRWSVHPQCVRLRLDDRVD